MMGFNTTMAGLNIVGLVTWLAVIFFLILGSIYFLKEIRKK